MKRIKVKKTKLIKIVGLLILLGLLLLVYFYIGYLFPSSYNRYAGLAGVGATTTLPVWSAPVLDIADYDRRLLILATGTSSQSTLATISSTTHRLWPVEAPYPKAGAILPFKRIVAYYGNLYSTKMGILGEYPEAEMLQRLRQDVAKWEQADPATPVQPALHYIVSTAQESAGADGKHRFRMPESEVKKVLAMAEKVDGIVFLDIQVGLSNLQSELPVLEKYLENPKVHLAIDPEFSMKNGDRPGEVIGTFNAQDVNYTINFLTKIVQEHNLPPKILVIHRFTGPMLTGYRQISLNSSVQIVIDMDGWGSPERKIGTYNSFVASQPVQFTGFKLFYKNDLKHSPNRLLTPKELLSLKPRPIYIQYQ